MPSLVKLLPLAGRVARSLMTSGGPVVAPVTPARRHERALAHAVYWGLGVAIATSALLVAGLLTYDSHTTWVAWVKLTLGLAMLLEGLVLAINWRGARRLALWRIRHGRGTNVPQRMTLRRKIGEPLVLGFLQLLGLAWLAAGLLVAALALPDVF